MYTTAKQLLNECSQRSVGDRGQAYAHASQLVEAFAEVPMGVEVLVQIDRLVQLLETPAFTFLRLQLLRPSTHPALIQYAMPKLLGTSCLDACSCHVSAARPPPAAVQVRTAQHPELEKPDVLAWTELHPHAC